MSKECVLCKNKTNLAECSLSTPTWTFSKVSLCKKCVDTYACNPEELEKKLLKIAYPFQG